MFRNVLKVNFTPALPYCKNDRATLMVLFWKHVLWTLVDVATIIYFVWITQFPHRWNLTAIQISYIPCLLVNELPLINDRLISASLYLANAAWIYDIIMRNSCSLNCSRRHSVIFLHQKRYKSELWLRGQGIFHRLPISDIIPEMWLQPDFKFFGAIRISATMIFRRIKQCRLIYLKHSFT